MVIATNIGGRSLHSKQLVDDHLFLVGEPLKTTDIRAIYPGQANASSR